MVKHFPLSRAEFARRAGVSQAAVTKACKTCLKPATLEGGRIDAAHPAAVEYLNGPENNSPVEGVDPLHGQALEFFRSRGTTSVTSLRQAFGIGYKRARKILDTIEATQVNATGPKPERRKPHVRGTAAAKAKRKAESIGEITPEHINAHQAGADEIEIPADIRELLDHTLGEILHKFGTDTAFSDWLKATKSVEDIHEKRLKNAEKSGELISRVVVKEGLLATLDGAFTRMLTDGARTISVRSHSLVQAGGSVQEVTDLVEKQLSTFIKPTKSKLKRVLKNA